MTKFFDCGPATFSDQAVEVHGALVLKEQLDELIEIHAVLRNDTPDRGRVCGIERGKTGVTAEDAKNADPFMRCCQRSALRAYQ